MARIYIFDVDGTLTPSRRRMTKDFEMILQKIIRFTWINLLFDKYL